MVPCAALVAHDPTPATQVSYPKAMDSRPGQRNDNAPAQQEPLNPNQPRAPWWALFLGLLLLNILVVTLFFPGPQAPVDTCRAASSAPLAAARRRISSTATAPPAPRTTWSRSPRWRAAWSPA